MPFDIGQAVGGANAASNLIGSLGSLFGKKSTPAPAIMYVQRQAEPAPNNTLYVAIGGGVLLVVVLLLTLKK